MALLFPVAGFGLVADFRPLLSPGISNGQVSGLGRRCGAGTDGAWDGGAGHGRGLERMVNEAGLGLGPGSGGAGADGLGLGSLSIAVGMGHQGGRTLPVLHRRR